MVLSVQEKIEDEKKKKNLSTAEKGQKNDVAPEGKGQGEMNRSRGAKH